MHSSRMLTARLLTVSHVSWGGGLPNTPLDADPFLDADPTGGRPLEADPQMQTPS